MAPDGPEVPGTGSEAPEVPGTGSEGPEVPGTGSEGPSGLQWFLDMNALVANNPPTSTASIKGTRGANFMRMMRAPGNETFFRLWISATVSERRQLFNVLTCPHGR